MKTKIFITLLTFLLLSCSDSENQQSERTIQSDKNPNVKVVNPQQRSFTSTLRIIGNALPNKQVNIHAMEGGFLSALRKDIGRLYNHKKFLTACSYCNGRDYTTPLIEAAVQTKKPLSFPEVVVSQ